MSASTVFRLPLSQVEGRLDPLYYSQTLDQLLKKTPHARTKLGLLVDYMLTGFTAGKAEQTFDEGVIQIRPTNITSNGELVFDRNVYVPSNLLNTFAKDRLEIGEVLFNNTNSQELVGKTVLFDRQGDFFCSNHITRIKTKPSQLQATYLCALLNTYQNLGVFYRRCVNWNNQSGINTEALRNLEIPLPDLQTQQHIATIMRDAYEKKSELTTKAKVLLESVDGVLYRHLGIGPIDCNTENMANQIFKIRLSKIDGRFDPYANQPKIQGWAQKIKMGRYKAEPLHKLVQFRKEIVTKIPDQLTYIGLENVLSLDGTYSRTTEKVDINSAATFKKGHIIFPKLRPNLNKTHLTQFDGVCSTEFHVLNPIHISGTYLTAYLRSKSIVSVLSELVTGNTLPRLQTEDIFSIPIVTPPTEIQSKIADEVTSLHTQAQTLRQQAQDLLEQAQQETETLILGAVPHD